MPSPTSSTRPTSRLSIPVFSPVISCSITETISSTLNAITAPLDELVPDVQQARSDTRVVDPILNADDQPAQDGRIDNFLKHRLALADLADVLAQSFALVVGQRHRGADVD